MKKHEIIESRSRVENVIDFSMKLLRCLGAILSDIKKFISEV